MKKLETQEHLNDFIQSIDTLLIDMDGVLWQGNDLLKGVRETLTFLQKLGKKLIFVTNNSTKSRSAYVKKFLQLGISGIETNQIFGSAYIAACYLESLCFDKSKSIYVLGEAGLTDELTNLGYTTYGGLKDKDLRYENVDSLASIQPDSKIGAVLCGLDGHLNYMKLAKAHTYLMDPNVLFLATNMDPTLPAAGRTFPGSGSLFAPLVQSSGRSPRVLGKPDQNVYTAIQAVHSLDLGRTCMIGDRLETDIVFGKNIGCRTLLVLTGVTSISMLHESTVSPDYYMDGFGEFIRIDPNHVNGASPQGDQ